jgi:hypothetical protein
VYRRGRARSRRPNEDGRSATQGERRRRGAGVGILRKRPGLLTEHFVEGPDVRRGNTDGVRADGRSFQSCRGRASPEAAGRARCDAIDEPERACVAEVDRAHATCCAGAFRRDGQSAGRPRSSGGETRGGRCSAHSRDRPSAIPVHRSRSDREGDRSPSRDPAQARRRDASRGAEGADRRAHGRVV